MRIEGEKTEQGFKFLVELLDRPTAWVLCITTGCLLGFVISFAYLIPTHKLSMLMEGKGSIETGPHSRDQSARLPKETISDPVADLFPDGRVPIPKPRAYGYYDMLKLEQGSDRRRYRKRMSCDDARPIPRACFMHPADRFNYPEFQPILGLSYDR